MTDPIENNVLPIAPSAEDILARYRPDEAPVRIELPHGEVLTFAPIPSTAVKKKVLDQAQRYLNAIPAADSPQFKSFPNADVMPKDLADRALSYIIHLRSIEPKISERTAYLLHQAPELIGHIEKMLGLADKGMQELFRANLLEESRKKSRTPDSEDESSQG